MQVKLELFKTAAVVNGGLLLQDIFLLGREGKVMVTLENNSELGKLACSPGGSKGIPPDLQLFKEIMDKDGSHIAPVPLTLIMVKHILFAAQTIAGWVKGEEIDIPLLPGVKAG